MDIESLRDVVAVARRSSFTLAARERATVQSTISKRVAACEAELGVELFEREADGTRPTPLGSVFVDRATQIVNSYDTALGQISRLRHEKPESLSITTLRGRKVTSDLLAAACHELKESRPLLKLQVGPGRRLPSYEALRTGQADAVEVFVDSAEEPPDDIRLTSLYAEPADIVIPKWHKLAERASCPVAAIEGETLWVSPDPVYADIWKADLSLLDRYGCTVRTGYWTSQSEVVFFYDFDHGVQLQAASYWDFANPVQLRDRYSAVRVEDEGFLIETALATRKEDGSPALAAFLGTVEAVRDRTDFGAYRLRG